MITCSKCGSKVGVIGACRVCKRSAGRREFESFELAFDYCREQDRPVIAIVRGTPHRLFPSGKAVDLTACGKTQAEQARA